MKRTTSGIGAVAVGIAVLTFPGSYAQAQQRTGRETYVVRRGDTLSAISGRVFGDVKRWREILKENPQITNANRIYPGDTLLVPVPLAASAATGGGGEPPADAAAASSQTAPKPDATRTEIPAAPTAASGQGTAPAPGPEAGAPATPATTDAATTVLPMSEPVRPVAVVSPALYRSSGSIAENLPAIAIIASQDERILIGTGDAAIINAAYPPGTRFTVVRASHRVFHPRTRQSLGWLIRVLGVAEVTCRGERTSTVALRGMSDAAGIGDYLVPYDEKDLLEKNALSGKVPPGCLPPGTFDGVIVAFNEDQDSVGELELAYIDRGSASGVAPGQRFTIYREIAPEGRLAIGELQVLRAGLNTSTALVTSAAQEVQVGYFLQTR
jgi:hypothetical protein